MMAALAFLAMNPRVAVPVTIFGTLILAFVGLIFAAIHAHRKRMAALSLWAAKHGLDFSPERDRTFRHQFPAFDIFQQGHSRYAENIMTGQWRGYPVILFSYHYETGNDEDESSNYFSGVLISSSLARQPLRIRPECGLDKMAAFFGLDDIDFESAEFSRIFHVKAKNRKWAYDVLHPRAMEFLLAYPKHTIEIQPGWVLVMEQERIFDTPRFEIAADLGTQLLDMIPEYVKERG